MSGLVDESGQSLVLGSVCIVTLLAFAGLAIDVGQIRYAKRQMQAAVDAAALAGAIEMSTCGSTSDCSAMTTAAKAALSENGFTISTPLTQCASNSSSSLTLWVNNGPCYLGSTTADPNYGSTKYVEAVLTGPVNTIFAGVAGFKTMKITVRSEAAGAPSSYCMVVSADSASSTKGITLQGGSTGGISAPTCGIYDDDSSSSNAVTDNSGTVTSKKFMVVGTGIQNSGATINPSPTTGQTTLADPLTYLSSDAPTAGSCTSQSSTPANGATLTAATFCSGITLNSNVSVTMGAGTYYIENGITTDSGSTLNGTAGVTVYVATGQVNLNSGSTVELVAPTTGTLAGIALWQAASDTDEINLDSGASSEFDGAIYAPTAEMTFNSATNAAACTLVDVGSVMLDSGASFSIGSNCSAFSSSQAFKTGSAAMVE
jgi:Putative Flp pilus-assembly TadE/G-like